MPRANFTLFSAYAQQQQVGAAKALLCRNNFPLSRQKVMWFSRPSDPPPDEALDADEREEVRSQAEEMGVLGAREREEEEGGSSHRLIRIHTATRIYRQPRSVGAGANLART